MAVPIVYQNFIPPAIDAGNLNTINNVVYTVIGDGVNAPLNAANVRTNLGLGTLATQNANAIAVTGGTVAGITSTNSTIVAGTVSSLLTPLSLANGGTNATTKAGAQTSFAGDVMSAVITSNQTLTNAAFTTILFQTKDFDTGTFYTTGTGAFQPTVAGYYLLTWTVAFDGNGSTITNLACSLFKNAALYQFGTQIQGPANLTAMSSGAACLVFFNGTTDFVNVQCFSTTAAGAARTIAAQASRFTAMFVRP